MSKFKKIYCCECKKEVRARLTYGKEIYPHRKDLDWMPFWKCDVCKNYVGCHHKSQNFTAPLGFIPTPELRALRNEIHKTLDPIWKDGLMKRNDIYKYISKKIGWRYHTAKIKSVEEATHIFRLVEKLSKEKRETA